MQKHKIKLTIGFVLDDSLDSSDGVQQYVCLIGNWLTGRGHDVHYITSSTKRTDIPNIHSLGKVLRVGFNKNKVGTPLPVSNAKVKKLFNQLDFDILHVQMPYSPFFAHQVLINAPKNTAIAGTFHILPYSTLERLAIRALGLILRPSLRRFTGACAVSEPAAKLCKNTFGLSDTKVIPNAVDVNRFRNLKKSAIKLKGSKKIVFLGRLVKRKGCMEFLQALKLIKDSLVEQGCRVYICSDGPERKALEDYVCNNSLRKQVTFLGFITEEEKVSYLQQADVAVFPSLGGESFGIVLLEAMAAGSGVVLAGNNPGYTSVMSSIKQQLIDPLDTQAFADCIRKSFSDNTIRIQAASLQNQLVMRFDVNTVGKQIEAMYKDAIALQRKTIHNRK